MTSAVRAVLWDADGVLQRSPPGPWGLAGRVVDHIPDAMTGGPFDEQRVRAVADELGFGDRIADVLSVWTTFDVLTPTLDVVARVRAAGTPCHLATNQDAFRAATMRAGTPYPMLLDGAFYSCDLGVAKPSTAFFVHVVTALRLAPHQVLFLDDRPANVAGARAAGLLAEQWHHDDGIAPLLDHLVAHGVLVAE